jgi:hypothetical protein
MLIFWFANPCGFLGTYIYRFNGSLGRYRKCYYSPIAENFNSYVDQGAYRHDDDSRDDDFSHRVKSLVACKKDTELLTTLSKTKT